MAFGNVWNAPRDAVKHWRIRLGQRKRLSKSTFIESNTMLAFAVLSPMLFYVGAGELRKDCGSTDFHTLTRCNQYVTAVSDTVSDLTPSGAKARYCIPKGTPRIALMAAFNSYYDSLPGLDDLPAATVVRVSFEAKCPCGK